MNNESSFDRAAENFQQKQRYAYLNQAILHSISRAHRAEEAFKKWRREKYEITQQLSYERKSDKKDADPMENEKNFQAWVLRKNTEEKTRRDSMKNAEMKRLQEERQRELTAKQEYEKWLQSSKTKPKFVPMGQGLLSNRIMFLS